MHVPLAQGATVTTVYILQSQFNQATLKLTC